jgi:hypothetical protein
MDSVGNPNKELILNDVVEVEGIWLRFYVKFVSVFNVSDIDKLKELIINIIKKHNMINIIKKHNMKNPTVNIFRDEEGNPEYIFSLLVPQNDKFLKDAIIATERITINDDDDMGTVYNTVSENLPKLCSEIIEIIEKIETHRQSLNINPQNEPHQPNKNNPYIKPALITLGSIAGIIIIMLGIYKYVKKRKHNKEDKQNKN